MYDCNSTTKSSHLTAGELSPHSGARETLSVFGTYTVSHLNENTCLHDRMKYQFRPDGPVVVQEVGGAFTSTDGIGWPRSVLANEMSASLPNLAVGSEPDILKKLSGSHVRSSLSDIWSKNDKHSPITNKASNHEKTLSLEDCPTFGQNNAKSVVKYDLLANASSTSTASDHSEPAGELTINVAANNNRLSAVLENIPLLYIPHTKQLVSMGCNGASPQQRCESGVANETSGKLPQEVTPALAVVEMQESAKKCDTHTSLNHSEDALDVKEREIAISASWPEVSHQQTAQCTSFEPSQDSQNQACCDLDSVNSCGVGLSQDSDVSAKSERTVVDSLAAETNSQGDHNISSEQEENQADELTKLNEERDSPKSDSFPRTNTMGSLSRTDASSFSSISSISTGTEFSNSAVSYSDDIPDAKPQEVTEDGFVEINLHARNSFEKSSRNSSQDSGIDEKQVPQLPSSPVPNLASIKQKRRGITGFLARSLFSRKTREPATAEHAALGWKLFGKVQPKQIPLKDPSEISKEYKSKVQLPPPTSTTPPSSCRMKKADVEAPSTTALILEQRPIGLPSKTPEEELRHQQEYDAMVEASKKKEMKEAKHRKKLIQQQLKHEDALSAAVKIWNNEILPSWDTMYTCKKARELWWNGCPPSVRGKVWKLAIGNDLNLTPELYEICLERAKDRLKIMRELAESDTDSLSSFTESSVNKEASVELIKLDVSRTFPQLCIFQKGGPYHDLLQGLLGAYACYRPDVGYVQGMSFIAAVLLLNMDVDDAFICFANLLNQPCQIAFFRLDETLMKSYFDTYEEFFNENLPKLHSHFQKQSLSPDLYIIDWMFTLYSKSLPLDVASRVWDVFCRDGEEFLFRTALGILKHYEEVLLNMDFIHLAQFLTRLPENISDTDIFRNIDRIHMVIENKRFSQVLAAHREPKDS